MHKGIWLLLAVVSVTCLSLAAFWFGSSYGDGSATPEAVSNADPAHAADDVGEGINVHGDWELTVSDQDGSNAMVYNFENKLAQPDTLYRLLLPFEQEGASKILDWQIQFSRHDLYEGQGADDILCKSDWEATQADLSGLVSASPLVDVMTAGGFKLTGSCVVDESKFDTDEELHFVWTETLTQTVGASGMIGAFTHHNVPAGTITVSPGQLIAVTVKITFE